MNRENAFVRLAGLLANRATEEYAVDTAPASVAAVIVRAAELSPQDADALAWGRAVDLEPQAVERLAQAFGFHAGILGCVLRPSSLEGVEHSLREAKRDFCPQECGFCDTLVERSWMLGESAEEREDPLDICLDALEHLRPAREEDVAAGQAAGDDNERLSELVNILPEASRLRVLAFAYQELAEVTSGQPIGQLAAYSRLRSDYLTPLSRALLDHLACSPEGELTARELAARLNLSSARLSRLLRSVEQAVARLARDGHPLHEEPLELRYPTPRDRRLRLGPKALSSWRSLLRAEEEVLQGQGDVFSLKQASG